MSTPARPPRAAADRPRSRPVRLRVRYRLTPWWVKVLVVFVLSRAVSTALLLWFAAHQLDVPGWVSAAPGYAEYANIWDGQWYWRIATYGYPSDLPTDASGHITENAWAFMPAYPFLVEALSTVTRVPWTVMSFVVSLLFGAGTVLLFHRLLAPMIGGGSALFAVVLYCSAPVSPLLQVGYAESMQAFFLTLALLLLVRRRYGWLFPVIAVLALTRPTGLAFALAVGLYWLYRMWRRRSDPFPPREVVTVGAVAVFSGLMGLLWPALAWIATGIPDAYVQTELAWRAGYIGRVHLVPFQAWFQGADWWLGGSPLAPVLVVALVVLFALCFLLPPVRRLGIELRLWAASYGLYLLAVFFPQSSTFRLLMPMFPLLGAAAVPRNAVYRVGLVVLGVVGQWFWLWIAWSFQGLDWTPP